MATKAPMQLGMVGLGRMGAGLARWLMRDGHSCVAHDVSPQAVKALEESGAAGAVPGDPVLNVVGRDIALTGVYNGRRRMTLTYPVLERAPNVFWLVTGAGKADGLARLIAGDRSIPAGRVSVANAVVIADRAAAYEAIA